MAVLTQNEPKDEPKQQSLTVEACRKMAENGRKRQTKNRIQMDKAFDCYELPT
jgi:hypothetical protein